MRYVLAALGVALGVAVVAYGGIALAYTDTCDTYCGEEWIGWAMIVAGAGAIIGSCVWLVRTRRRDTTD